VDILDFAKAHGLKPRLHKRGNSIRGRAGRLLEDDEFKGCAMVEVNDLSELDRGNGVVALPAIDLANPLQAKLALEVIETRGHKRLTANERREKVNLLCRLRSAQVVGYSM
jgi:hypothetical protein